MRRRKFLVWLSKALGSYFGLAAVGSVPQLLKLNTVRLGDARADAPCPYDVHSTYPSPISGEVEAPCLYDNASDDCPSDVDPSLCGCERNDAYTVCPTDGNADPCSPDICTVQDGCASDASIRVCRISDVCGKDLSGDCRGDLCDEDASGACVLDDCRSDSIRDGEPVEPHDCLTDRCVADISGDCKTDACTADASLACNRDYCVSDSAGTCELDACTADKSGDGYYDACVSDSSKACQIDRCTADSTGECHPDACVSDSSDTCHTDVCTADSSGICTTDHCTSDSSGNCTADKCVSDSSGACLTDTCTADSSGDCAQDHCISDSSKACVNDRCGSDASGTCSNQDVCVKDSSGNCGTDLCRDDNGGDCATRDVCATDTTPPKAADASRALRWLYRLSIVLLMLNLAAPGDGLAATVIDARDAVFSPDPTFQTGQAVTVPSPVGPMIRDCDSDGFEEVDTNGDGLCAGDPELRDYNADGSRELPDGTPFAGSFQFTCVGMSSDVALVTTGPVTLYSSGDAGIYGAVFAGGDFTLAALGNIDLHTSAWMGSSGLTFRTALAGEVDQGTGSFSGTDLPNIGFAGLCGAIVAPGAVNDIPVLNAWGMMALAWLLAFSAWWAMSQAKRRRKVE